MISALVSIPTSDRWSHFSFAPGFFVVVVLSILSSRGQLIPERNEEIHHHANRHSYTYANIWSMKCSVIDWWWTYVLVSLHDSSRRARRTGSSTRRRPIALDVVSRTWTNWRVLSTENSDDDRFVVICSSVALFRAQDILTHGWRSSEEKWWDERERRRRRRRKKVKINLWSWWTISTNKVSSLYHAFNENMS